jgi:hypothetical protein
MGEQMQINRLGGRNEVFLQAQKYTRPAEVTQQGIREAKDLSAQYGTSRKIVAFGDHAIAFETDVFSELEAKFGKAKTLDGGAFVFGKEGSDYIASWHGTVLHELGYEAADNNKDGIITNREARGVKGMIDFNANGQVFLRPPKGDDLPNDDSIFATVQNMFNLVVHDDKNKDGVITTAEVKQGYTHIDIDAERQLAMTSRGQNPDGSFQIMDEEGFTITAPDPATGKKKTSAAHIGDKLRGIEAQILALRGQGIDDGDPKIKQLQAAEKAALAELKQSGEHQPIDVKA